jgi:hypothetical protein
MNPDPEIAIHELFANAKTKEDFYSLLKWAVIGFYKSVHTVKPCAATILFRKLLLDVRKEVER